MIITSTLQWGRGISAADTALETQNAWRYAKLQWGRGISAADTYAVTCEECGGRGASMGPRHFSRGYLTSNGARGLTSVSYTHLRAHETKANLVCRLLLEKKKK